MIFEFLINRGGYEMKTDFWRKVTLPFLLIAVFVLVGSPATLAAQWFGDVSEEHTHYEGIKSLTEQGIISGYPDNTFRPEEALTRQHGAVLLSKAGDYKEPADLGVTLKNYVDIDQNSKYAKEIAMLTEAKVFVGDPAGNFNPTEKLTREQMATVLVKALSLEQHNTGQNVDINLSNVHEVHKKDVQILANLGITKEVKDYQPKKAVTRGEISSFIDRASHVGQFELSVMHMNDSHARVAEMPKAITAIKEVRAENPEALLFHGGDAFSGTLYFTEFEGQADVALMNLMGISAMVFGNHEFDLGDSENGHQSLASFVSDANFPVLGTNIDFSGDDILKGLVSETEYANQIEQGKIHKGLIKEVDGEKIGVFGLTTESTAFVASPKAVKFLDYKKSAEEAVAYFEKQGVNKIIAVNHIGYDSDPSVGNDLLLAELVDGIDIIVGGHSHTKLDKPVYIDKKENGDKKDPTIIVQADQYLTNIGLLTVQFDENGVISSHSGELMPLADKEEDAEALEALSEFSNKVDEMYTEEIGATLEVDLPNPRHRSEGEPGESVRANETALGNVITDGMLAKAKEYDADTVIALQNGGGIRTDMKKGPITMGGVLEVLPFGNTLSLVTLTGAELKNTLEHSVRNSPNEEGGFLHVAGMKFTFDSSKPVSERVQSMQVLDGNEYVKIDMEKEYRITTNAFTARGGDGFEVLGDAYEQGRVTDLGLDDWVNFRDHLIELGTVAPEIEGRIVNVSGK